MQFPLASLKHPPDNCIPFANVELTVAESIFNTSALSPPAKVEVAPSPYMLDVDVLPTCTESSEEIAVDETKVNVPAAAVLPPIVTPSNVEVATLAYQVEVAKAPVKRLAESVVNAPVDAVDSPMLVPSQVEVAIE